MGNTPFWVHKETGMFFYARKELPADAPSLEYWDSVLEYRVYQKLLDFLKPCQISRQVNILILPAKEPFKKWVWNVDFVVTCNSIIIPIEVKGQWLLADAVRRKSFCQTLQVLQREDESLFNKLLIIGDSDWRIPSTNLVVFSLSKVQQKIAMLIGG